MRPFFLSLLILVSSSVSAAPYFYKVGIAEGSKIKFLSGSSPLAPEQFIKSIQANGFTKLSDLFYFNKGDNGPEFNTWSRWNDYLEPERWLKNSKIVSVQPYKGNPYNTAGIEYPLKKD